MNVENLTVKARSEASRWLALAERLVAVDTGPGDFPGAQQMIELLSAEWQQLGFLIEVKRTEPPVFIARRSAATEDAPHAIMLGHYDTVFPHGTAQTLPLTIERGRALGAGAADMKLGLVTQLAAVDLAGSECRQDVTVVINGDEESGSVASRETIERESSRADSVLVFEPGQPDGAIVRSRPGVSRFRIRTTGIAAHSGVAPETGRNAIEGLAHLVLAIQEVGRKGRYGTITVSLIEGGSRPNVVPASAGMVIDARVHDTAAATGLRDELEKLAARIYVDGVSANIEELDSRPPLEATQASIALANELSAISVDEGLAIDVVDARGTSDGNFTSALGIPTVDGLGPPGGDLHTDHEWAEVDGIFTRAAMVAGFLVKGTPRP